MDFCAIDESYKRLHKDFLKKSPILVKYMDKHVWAPSISKEIYKIFQRYGSKEKNMLDLGSGDGVAVMVGSLFFKHARGVEIEKEFFDISLRMKKKLKIKNVSFVHNDYQNLDLGEYDVLFIAPDNPFTLKLENKIEKELNGLLIVYSSIFQPKTLKKKDHFTTSHFDVYVYENTPKKV